MTTETYVEELKHDPPSSGPLPWIATAVSLLLLAATGVYAWSAHGRATTAEQAAAMAAGERDATMTAAEQGRQLTAEANVRVQAAETARQDLERQLQAANDTVARLKDELEAKTAEAAEAAFSAPSVASAPSAVTPAAPWAAKANAAPPAPAKVKNLTITFDANSSYFPADLGGNLKRLADRLQPGTAYAVEITGTVGGDAASQDEDARYDRWLAERRMNRVAGFLQKNAETERLEIKQAFAANDPSRRVVVEVRPLPQ